jgi:hypothetical protein
METKSIKTKTKKNKSHSIRVANENRKWIDEILKTANKKEQGRSIKIDDLLSLLREKVQASDIELLQDQSLTNEDRREILRQKYIETRGHISKDSFLGFLASAEFSRFVEETGLQKIATFSYEKKSNAA